MRRYIVIGPDELMFISIQVPGGIDYDADFYDETLEFQPDTEEWSLASRMIEARVGHAR